MKANPKRGIFSMGFKVLISLLGFKKSIKTCVYDPNMWVIFIVKRFNQILFGKG